MCKGKGRNRGRVFRLCNGVLAIGCFAMAANAQLADCNENGIEDGCDLSTSSCQASQACADSYGAENVCLIPDANGNATPDDCENCNGNEVPDECDINCEDAACDKCF